MLERISAHPTAKICEPYQYGLVYFRGGVNVVVPYQYLVDRESGRDRSGGMEEKVRLIGVNECACSPIQGVAQDTR